MGIRPKMEHAFGCPLHKHPHIQTWLKVYYEELSDDSFVETTKTLWEKVAEQSPLMGKMRQHVEQLTVGEMVQVYDQHVMLLPPMHARHSRMYAHDLLYTMTEAGLFPEKRKIIPLSYQDCLAYVGSTEEEMIENEVDFDLMDQLKTYKGNWARKYANSSLRQFDYDFEFIYELLLTWGFQIQRKDIERYLICDWV